MAAFLPGVQQATAAASASSAAVCPSVAKSCRSCQSSQIVCAPSQLCCRGLSGAFLRRSNRISLGRGYVDIRKRFKGKYALKATASAEQQAEVFNSSGSVVVPTPTPTPTPFDAFKFASEDGSSGQAVDAVKYVSDSGSAGTRLLSAKEKYLQSINGGLEPPKSENVDMFGGFKDMFKGFGNTGDSVDSSVKGDVVKSATGNDRAGDAILNAKKQLLQSFGGGGEIQSQNEANEVDVLGGLKDAKTSATDSVNNFFKGITDSMDSVGKAIKDTGVKSATEEEIAGETVSSATESVQNMLESTTDSVDSVGNVIKENGIKPGDQDGSLGETMSSVNESVDSFFKGPTDSVDSVGNSIKDSVVKSSTEDGSSGEALSTAKDSMDNIFKGITDNVDSASKTVEESVQNSMAEDGLAGKALSSVKESVDNLPIQDNVDSTANSVSDIVMKSATEDVSSGETLSTVKDSMSDVIKDITDTVNSAGSSANDSVVVKTATESGSAGEVVLSAKERYLQSIGGGLKQSQNEDVFDGLKGADIDVFSSLKDAQNAVTGSVNNFVKSITDAIDSAGNQVKSSYESFNGSLVKAVKSATGSVDKSVSGLQPNVDGIKPPRISVDIDFTAPFRMGTPANDALKEVVVVVKDVTGTVLVTAGELLTKFYASAKSSLPEDALIILNDIEEKTSQIAQPLGSAFDQAYAIVIDVEKSAGINPENPVIPVILVVGGTLFLSVSYFQSKYGGYAGDLPPNEALDLLKNEGNVVMVDIRPQEIREAEGIPDLRRSARFKFAAVEVVKADKTIRGQLKNAGDIDSLLTAAVIRNLKNVDGGTKIIVLDEDGTQSKQIARGLRKTGSKRAYRVDGGFKAWASQGLRSKMDIPQTPLTILKEETEAIVEEVKPTVAGVVGVSVGLVAGTYALLEWERTLQLIGVIGLAATLYIRVESYESVEDVKADIQLLQKPFKSFIQAILLLTGQAEKGELQLATSPASSAVQGRMLQAAAKHGPLASEMEQQQDESSPTPEDEMSSAVDSELNESHSASMQEPPQ
ncbi:hypothetical protein MPTK1_6g15980 [Marchantia polymorpha subsp. ruderalis]|uniref:Rhodanese domain-containing protein n=2 Tax=Marchantia polymorpha TaxID=3197 RepID=A0A176WAV0_MARPO|nr:hypothetical protein AXG93_4295s1340 [Marchantia polymorpha subsp. ruderalis]PTQ37663.1 hypothetical protein MARPO_0056s0110 [Marchantia polymorpha]BBN14979.1 hypothetical protein Mp_6g15980 [Marchantia polymorpha subsp. ruderalis]|eukprot:PTQ37663.1 hypothetical protein MARPO_0056s0110 [Marchantia polymorpha]